MSSMGLYFIPMIITIVSTMILIYYFGGDTIGEVLICPFFNVLAYIQVTNIAMATMSVMVLFAIFLLEIGDIKIVKKITIE
jgi:hypothetical protein